MTKPQKLYHCAIYTRKSTEHNLDLEFNSLDAQREACEAYIKSQAQEGWRLVPNHYDDGGLSGASLERPALQSLLGDIEAKKVDIVVVYKVDRLTRSLTDFAKLVELFDRHEVSFVSITQSFNTTTSMGRLTLNVLLSFAQFEREVIGERVRDKIAASKRKGLWVGGPVSLGYQSIDKKLVVVPDEAVTVRHIYRRYLELNSVGDLAEDLHRNGFLSKQRKLKNGDVIGGGRYSVGALTHLLRNRFYIGEVVYRGEVHPGEHEQILDKALFEAVQARLNANGVIRRSKTGGSPSLLTGKIFDEANGRMTPTHSSKDGARYRYYISNPVLQRKPSAPGHITRVPAAEIEALVLVTLNERSLTDQDLERVTIRKSEIEISFASGEGIQVPWVPKPFKMAKGITSLPGMNKSVDPGVQTALLKTIAKSRQWLDDLVKGRASSIEEIAVKEGKGERHIRLLLPLAFSSPDLIQRIIDGGISADITITAFARAIPDSWDEQARLFRA